MMLRIIMFFLKLHIMMPFSRNLQLANFNYSRQITIDNTTNGISENTANRLITEITANNICENQRRRHPHFGAHG